MCLKISRKTECAHNCRPEGSTFNQQICALDVYNGQLYCSPLLLPSNKFDCPSVSCPAFFFVTLLHFQISAIHSEGISIDTNDSKKYKNKTLVSQDSEAKSNVNLSPNKYSYINICVCVVTAEAQTDIQEVRGGRFWVALREVVHPAILSSLPHPRSFWSGPIWGRCVTNRWASHKRTPPPAKPVSCTPD